MGDFNSEEFVRMNQFASTTSLRSADEDQTKEGQRNKYRNAFAKALPHCMDGLHPLRFNHFCEPDYVAGLALNLPGLLNKEYGLRLRFGGCFIHGSPYVAFKDKVSCELGDLLVLYREAQNGKERYNAALIQHKMASTNHIDEKQFDLYSSWPQFNFGHKVNSNKTQYDVNPKTIFSGAEYSYIHDQDSLRFTMSQPSLELNVNGVDLREGEAFEDYLADLVTWERGREVFSRVPGQSTILDAWSKLIWDVVEKTSKMKGFLRRNVCEGRQPRTVGEFFELLLRVQCLEIETPPINCEVCAEELDGVCSILFIDKGEMLQMGCCCVI